MNEQTSPAGAGPLEPSVRPCPFCSSTNGAEEQGDTYRWIRWRCADCGAIGPEVRCNITAASSRGGRDEREARKLALESWNERIHTPDVLRQVAHDAAAAERHACSIAVWMTKMDAAESDADDKGVAGWLEEAEQRVKRRA